MNVPYYIAQRISKSSTSGNSGTIIKIAIVSISLSVAIMILSSAVLLGFKKQITEKVFGFWGHIHITDTRMSRTFELSPVLNDEALKDSIRDIPGLSYAELDREGNILGEHETEGGVESISPFIRMPGIVNSKNSIEGIVLKGVNEEYEWSKFKDFLKQGSFPNIKADSVVREMLISEQTAKRMQVSLGDKVIVYFVNNKEQIKRGFKVCGIYRTGLEEYDRKFAFIDMGVIQNVMQWEKNQVGGFEVFIEAIKDAGPIADYIYEDVLPGNLYAETIEEKFGSMFDWIEMQDINGVLLFLLMLLVALVNMCTALLILILERTRMIGVLKSVGLSNWKLRKVFIFLSSWILLLSLLFGNLIGIGLGLIQKTTGFVKLNEANYYLSEVPIHFDLLSILGINLGTILVTILVMIIPTYLVTKIKPIDILQFQ